MTLSLSSLDSKGVRGGGGREWGGGGPGGGIETEGEGHVKINVYTDHHVSPDHRVTPPPPTYQCPPWGGGGGGGLLGLEKLWFDLLGAVAVTS